MDVTNLINAHNSPIKSFSSQPSPSLIPPASRLSQDMSGSCPSGMDLFASQNSQIPLNLLNSSYSIAAGDQENMVPRLGSSNLQMSMHAAIELTTDHPDFGASATQENSSQSVNDYYETDDDMELVDSAMETRPTRAETRPTRANKRGDRGSYNKLHHEAYESLLEMLRDREVGALRGARLTEALNIIVDELNSENY
ncbi:unnamed protein product [Ambrosiozyma monospora]|uniref:Unnamed protein product n=1 Tax=Ambrosiozyma monospora TaxID=43982 RepID=A0ACB5U7H8_AMBMO|nr:unnamed protein product [Ambrosiozyma monospora]